MREATVGWGRLMLSRSQRLMTVLHHHPAHRSLSLTMIHPPHKGEGKENVMRICSRLAHAAFATHEMPHYPWRGVRGNFSFAPFATASQSLGLLGCVTPPPCLIVRLDEYRRE